MYIFCSLKLQGSYSEILLPDEYSICSLYNSQSKRQEEREVVYTIYVDSKLFMSTRQYCTEGRFAPTVMNSERNNLKWFQVTGKS